MWNDFLNICLNDLLHECSNFVMTNISCIAIRIGMYISSNIHEKRWNVITKPYHNFNGSSWGPAVECSCLPMPLIQMSKLGHGYWSYIQCIIRIMLKFQSADVLVCRRFGLSTFWSVDVLVCRRFGLSMFRSVDVLVRRRFGFSTFRFVDVLVCRRFGLSTFWLSTFRFVDVLTSNRC